MSQRLRDIVKPWGVSAHVPDVSARHLTLDSRQVSHNDIFVALRGHALDGRDFIAAAICQGACAILVDADHVTVDQQWSVPVIELTQLPQRLGEIAARFYGVSADKPTVVGVTGTNGKTSVSHYLATLLGLLDAKAGVMGTLGYGEPSQLTPLANTTPDALTVHRLLAELSEGDKPWVAMEVSSHGLVQNRVAGVPFSHAIFTNLSRDHLDYHGSMQAYGAAKATLFSWPTLRSATINLDDPFAATLLEHNSAEQLIVYGLEQPEQLAHYSHWLTFKQIQPQANGFVAQLDSSWGQAELRVPLLGRFNLHNLLAALGPLLAAGYALDDIAQVVPQMSAVEGRMEAFSQPLAPHCIVDYAHTPDALKEALSAAQFHCSGTLWCVFGCGGDRDRGKRPLMAEMAERYAQRVVVTSDNPRSESQSAIAAEIRQGFMTPSNVIEIADRKQAIAYALQHAGPDDLIVIAGKGHETYQEIAGTRLYFSDRDVVRQLQEVAS